MNTDIRVVRAIGAEFLARKLIPFYLLSAILAVTSIGLAFYLTTLNKWWVILLICLMLTFAAVFATLTAMRLVVRFIRPYTTGAQREAVKGFVDKMERITDGVGTPPFIVALRVLKDVARPRGKTFIRGMADDSITLRHDYVALRRMF